MEPAKGADKRIGLRKNKVFVTVLSERLHKFRVKHKLTQKDMADLCSVHPATIFRIEHGKEVSYGIIKRIADNLEMPVRDLMGPSDKKREEIRIDTSKDNPPLAYPAPDISYTKKQKIIEEYLQTMTLSDIPPRLERELHKKTIDTVLKMIINLVNQFYSLEIEDRQDVMKFLNYKLYLTTKPKEEKNG